MNKLKIKNKKIIIILKYIVLAVMFYIFNNAQICYVKPFAVSLLFALVWTGFNPVVVSTEFLLAGLFETFSLEQLYVLITEVAVVLFFYVLHKKFKKPLNLVAISLYMVLSQITYVYYYITMNLPIFNLVAYFVLLIFSLYMFSLVFQTLLLRGLFYKLSINETIAFCFLLFVFGVGNSHIVCFGFEFAKFCVVVLVLFLNLMRKNNQATFLALSFGVGVFVGSFDQSFLVLVSVLILATNLFKYPHKLKMMLTSLLCEATFYLFDLGFCVEVIFSLIESLTACLLVLIIPKKQIEKVQDKFYACESEMSMRNIVNLTRQSLHKRFKELSNVFSEMSAIHLELVKDDLSKEQLTNLITAELMKSICRDCKSKQFCFESLGLNEKSQIAKLVEIGLTKGKISLLDIPSKLAIKCNMINLMIGRINQLIIEYKESSNLKNEINNIKYLLSEQIGAVSKIMLDLGEEIDKHINFDAHNELEIVNELLNENIVCSELVLYDENEDDYSVSLIVKGENAYNPKIEEILSKKLKTKMRVDKVEPIELNDYYSVHLVKDENYDIIFGLTNYVKTGSAVSGDTHSLIRLGKNKFLVALCDGMGSGEKANRTSALTISLIENFYKAGFSNDLIVSSVNKLLSINNQETFATLDLAIIDLNKQLVDFIKIGASYSYIKHENYLEKIDGGALPIGVLDNINPLVYKTSINNKSMIIMTTDGVADAFKDNEYFERFLKTIVSTNPQTVAQTIIDEAVRQSDGEVKDDMTVLVVRTYLKNG